MTYLQTLLATYGTKAMLRLRTTNAILNHAIRYPTKRTTYCAMKILFGVIGALRTNELGNFKLEKDAVNALLQHEKIQKVKQLYKACWAGEMDKQDIMLDRTTIKASDVQNYPIQHCKLQVKWRRYKV